MNTSKPNKSPESQHRRTPTVQNSPFIPPQPPQSIPQLEILKDPQPSESDTESSAKSTSPGLSKFAAIIICMLIIVASIVGLIIFFVVRNRKESEDAESQHQSELSQARSEIEAFRKNDTMLKLKLNDYETRLRALEAENVKLKADSDPNSIIKTFREQQGFPTEDDFDMPADPKPVEQKTDAEKTSKEKREELKRMINKPRETVADRQQKESDIKEAIAKKRDEESRVLIDGETNATIFTADDGDDEVEQSLMDSLQSGGVIVD